MQMVMFMKEIGRMIKLMGLVDIFTQMVRNTKGIGEKINSMVRVKKHGLMVHVTKAIM
jgi:hypothetical protein